MNYKLKTHAGDTFTSVSQKAKLISHTKGVIVEFEFNGIICLVNDKTELDLLWRDYLNAYVMEWKTIGPECVVEYDEQTTSELQRRKKERDDKYKLQAEEQQKKDDAQCESVLLKTKDTQLQLIAGMESDYAEWISKNSNDGYSRAVVDYSEAWAKLMQIEVESGKTIAQCADETQIELGYLGISGFQYGCVVQSLAHFWIHGNELRKWHNKQYGVAEEKEGTVNPAILKIATP